MNNALLETLLNTLIVLGIIFVIFLIAVVIFFIYWFIWTALYIPINKKFKYDEAVIERDKEFNKLKVEHADLIVFTEEQKKVFEQTVLKKQEVLDEIKLAEKELQRKQALISDQAETVKLFNIFRESPEGLKWLAKIKKERAKEESAPK